MSLKKGEDFQEFYDNICEILPEMNTFEELLKVLHNPNPSVASGARTLITAMAEVYREKYFQKYYDDPTFGIFWESDPDIPLKEIIFSATEFKTGLVFRFQKSQSKSVIGNGNVWIHEKYAKHIRMSDIMAASSCIPGAMEPIMFPQDSHWPGEILQASRDPMYDAQPAAQSPQHGLKGSMMGWVRNLRLRTLNVWGNRKNKRAFPHHRYQVF